MSNRLNKEREEKLQPVRIEFALVKLAEIGITPIFVSDSSIQFIYNGAKIILYPYSGWFTGKGITDGRGIDKLLKQLKH